MILIYVTEGFKEELVIKRRPISGVLKMVTYLALASIKIVEIKISRSVIDRWMALKKRTCVLFMGMACLVIWRWSRRSKGASVIWNRRLWNSVGSQRLYQLGLRFELLLKLLPLLSNCSSGVPNCAA